MAGGRSIDDRCQVTFWGVRGSTPCPGPQYVKYGGNTSCIHVQWGDRHVVFDAGTGIRGLGATLKGDEHIDLLFSHCHLDHICGFPEFKPFFNPALSCHIRAGHLPAGARIKDVLEGLMSPPTFPVPLGALKATLSFEDFTAGDEIDLGGGVRAGTMPLNHTNGATAYRLTVGGRVICYVTDVEHDPAALDTALVAFIEGADLFIYDCSFTDDEYRLRNGRGHSTWQEGARLANAGRVKRFAIFHHDPSHDDSFMDAIAKEAHQMCPAAFVSRDGMQLAL